MMFVFTTAEDYRVCPECSTLAGLVYDPQTDVPMIPVHPNCRCRYILFNDSELPLIPFIPIALPMALGECPEGYHWSDEEITCVPDET